MRSKSPTFFLLQEPLVTRQERISIRTDCEKEERSKESFDRRIKHACAYRQPGEEAPVPQVHCVDCVHLGPRPSPDILSGPHLVVHSNTGGILADLYVEHKTREEDEQRQ
jgi:hypothetical protein